MKLYASLVFCPTHESMVAVSRDPIARKSEAWNSGLPPLAGIATICLARRVAWLNTVSLRNQSAISEKNRFKLLDHLICLSKLELCLWKLVKRTSNIILDSGVEFVKLIVGEILKYFEIFWKVFCLSGLRDVCVVCYKCKNAILRRDKRMSHFKMSSSVMSKIDFVFWFPIRFLVAF